MRVEPMHDKNNLFRLIGYRLVAENRDEERILNLNQWSVKREQFTQETAIHLLTLPLHHVAGLAKEPSAT